MRLSMMNDQGMILSEYSHICRQSSCEGLLNSMIGFASRNPSQALEQSAGVGIDHETRLSRRIHKDCIGRLVTDPVDREKRCAQIAKWQPKQPREVAGMLSPQHGTERLEFRSFGAIEPCRANEIFQDSLFCCSDGLRS